MPVPEIKNLVLEPSPVDFRDKPAEAVVSQILGETPIPSEFELAPLKQKDQGQFPRCVGYSDSTVKENKERESGNNIEIDPIWLYDECKKIDGMPDFPGTFLRTAMLVLKNVGALPVGGDPNDAKLIASNRIAGFVRVETTPDAIKRAIYTLGAVLMGFRGSNGGWATAMIRPPIAGEEQWGHAVAGIGYRVDILAKGQNSWGEDWGDNGKFYVPLNYQPFEAWAIVKELPNNWQDINPLPENKPGYQFNNDLGPSSKINTEVKILQECLIYEGCMNREDVGENLGYFGPKTTKAVKVFQARYKIPQTGFVGPLTRGRLNLRYPATI